MKLPNYEQAVVAEAKITRYLLSETHEDGQHKAFFFIQQGFSMAKWEEMARALLNHAATYPIASTLKTTRGTHYSVEGELQTPDGNMPFIRSVWVIDDGDEIPRLITAYPIKRKTK